MTTSKPTVSLIVPCFNSGVFLREAIASCLWQTYSPMEIIVVDDGSSDGAVDDLYRMKDGRLYDGKKLRIFKQTRSGGPAARNRGLNEASGEFVKFLDADDLLMPGAVKEQVEISEKLGRDEVTYGTFAWFGAKQSGFWNRIVEQGDCADLVLKNILNTTPLLRTEHVRAVGGFDPRVRRAQEWNLHVRVAAAGVRFLFHPVPVLLYRMHGSQQRMTNQDKHTLVERHYEKATITWEAVREIVDWRTRMAFATEFFRIARMEGSGGEVSYMNAALEKGISLVSVRYAADLPPIERVMTYIFKRQRWELMRRNLRKAKGRQLARFLLN